MSRRSGIFGLLRTAAESADQTVVGDAVAEEMVLYRLELCREREVAVVLVSHDPQAAAYADRVLALRDGKLTGYNPEQGFAPAPTG